MLVTVIPIFFWRAWPDRISLFTLLPCHERGTQLSHFRATRFLLSLTSMNLKHFVFLLSIVSLAKANPIGFDDQTPLRYALNLNSLRLIQLEGKDPVWMTEIEKVGFLSKQLIHWHN